MVAIRALTGEALDLNLELQEPTTSRELMGPGGVFGTVDPDLLHDKAPDGRPIIEEWSTALFVIEDDLPRAGGLVSSIGDQGTKRAVSAPGYLNYPSEQPLLTGYAPTDWQDPVTVYRNLWTLLQLFPDGNIGMQVTGLPSTYMILGDGEGPYNFLPTDYRTAGQEMENVLSAARIEWTEKHTWSDASMTSISHAVELGFPRIGRRRDDLRFVQDENVIGIGALGANGDDYANDITVVGNGEGFAAVDAGLVQRAAIRDGRVRRARVVSDKTLTTPGLVLMRAGDEIRSRGLGLNVSEITMVNHPNAQVQDVGVGDDVLLHYDLPHRGAGSVWLRVTSIEEDGTVPGVAVLKTMRSDSFQYASPTNPNVTGEPFLVEV